MHSLLRTEADYLKSVWVMLALRDSHNIINYIHISVLQKSILVLPSL